MPPHQRHDSAVMVFPCQAAAKEISKRLNILADQIRTQTRAGYTDDNKDLEGLMARFFNALFGWDLTNLNVSQPNYPAADLGDFDRRLAFQITSTPDARKITTTAQKAAKHDLHLNYDTLILFFLLPEKPSTPAAFVQPSTGLHIKTWDLSDLLTLLSDGPELPALQAANNVLDHRLGSAGRSTPALSEPAALPKHAAKFIGRQAERDSLLPRFTANPRLAITGDGGLGKTALSAALLEAYRATPEGQAQTAHGLYAHNFYQLPSLEAFLSGILSHAGLESKDPATDRAQVTRLLRQPGILLYIEGAEQLPALEPFLDLIGPATALLLTTRHTVPLHLLPSLPIGPLEKQDAIDLLYYHAANYPRRLGQDPWPHGPEDPGWSDLARDLGQHPLACRLAGTNCGIHHKSPAVFHQQLKDKGLALLSHGNSSKENLNLLWRSAAQALVEKLPGEPSPAITAWHCLTLGGTNPTPFSILQALGAGDEHALTVLINHGLAESIQVPAAIDGATEPGYNLTHALLGEWAREGLTEFHRTPSDLLEPAMAWGGTLLIEASDHQRILGGPLRYSLISPLTESLLTTIERGPSLGTEQLFKFYLLPARIHHSHCQFICAEPFYRSALEVAELKAGPDSAPTLTALNDLAALLQATSRLAEAEQFMRRSLTISQANCQPDNPLVSTSLSNLAQLLLYTNNLSEAEPMMWRALAIDEACHGPFHSQVAIRLNNLASLLKVSNRMNEADLLLRRAVAIYEVSGEPNHPHFATCLNNLATLLQSSGQVDEAELLMRRALAIDETNFGANNPKVARHLNNLASLLISTQRLKEAETLLRRAVSIYEEVPNLNHQHFAVVLSNLAQVLHFTNRLADAVPLMRRALVIDESSLGSNHPEVARDLNNLAQLLLVMGHFEEAEALMRRVLGMLLGISLTMGSRHTNLDGAMQNYAKLCIKLRCSEDEIWERISRMGDEKGILREEMEKILGEVFS